MRTENRVTRGGIFLSMIVMSLGLLVPQTQAADNYQIDPVHTSLIFKVSHMGIGNIYGQFRQVSGSFVVDLQNPDKSAVQFEAKTESVDTNDEKRNQHVRSPDFLNAKQFPVIRFESSSARKLDQTSAEVSGTLTLHGISRPLTVTVRKVGEGKDPMGNQRLGVEASFTLKRSEFGITFMVDGKSDEIQVMLAAEGILAK
jgi:polyisoprenoid-binding protein YceI